jgi:hypothetical protein
MALKKIETRTSSFTLKEIEKLGKVMEIGEFD